MTKEEIQAEVDKMKKIDCYFIGTTAYHQLGDLNRGEGGDGDNLFHASGETDNYYIGMWVTGLGFFNVCFPKKTSRELTEEEIEKFSKTYIQIGSQPPIKLDVERNKRFKLQK